MKLGILGTCSVLLKTGCPLVVAFKANGPVHAGEVIVNQGVACIALVDTPAFKGGSLDGGISEWGGVYATKGHSSIWLDGEFGRDDFVYWDQKTKEVTTVAKGNFPFGFVVDRSPLSSGNGMSVDVFHYPFVPAKRARAKR